MVQAGESVLSGKGFPVIPLAKHVWCLKSEQFSSESSAEALLRGQSLLLEGQRKGRGLGQWSMSEQRSVCISCRPMVKHKTCLNQQNQVFHLPVT